MPRRKEEPDANFERRVEECANAHTLVQLKAKISALDPKASINGSKPTLCKKLLKLQQAAAPTSGSGSKSSNGHSQDKNEQGHTSGLQTESQCRSLAPIKKNLLRYSHNSCYVDCILTTFLTLPGLETVRRSLLEHPIKLDLDAHEDRMLDDRHKQGLIRTATYIRQELLRIRAFLLGANTMETGTARTIRRLFNRFDRILRGGEEIDETRSRVNAVSRSQRIDYESDQSDPSDVISMFKRMFQFETVVKGRTAGGEMRLPFDEPTIGFDPSATGLVKVSDSIPGAIKTNFSENNNKRTGKNNAPVSGLVLESAEALYIKVNRANWVPNKYYEEGRPMPRGHTEKLKTRLHPDATLAFKDQAAPLKLSAVIMHLGNSIDSGHYTAMMRFGGDCWFYYNDMGGPAFQYVGKYEDMLAWSLNKKQVDIAQTCSVGLIYTLE